MAIREARLGAHLAKLELREKQQGLGQSSWAAEKFRLGTVSLPELGKLLLKDNLGRF